MTVVYDNTRLGNFKRCPRYYYYRDVCHWVSEAKSLPLIFGSAWGKALDAVWLAATTKPRPSRLVMLEDGLTAFEAEWAAAGMPLPSEIDSEMQKELAPRTPAVAAEMLAAYLDERADLLNDDSLEMLGTETPFIVPLNEPRGIFYCGLLDKLLRHRGKILCIDHKSTGQYKKIGFFKSTFIDSFSPNSQVDGYLFALHQLFPGHNQHAVWIDAALVHKTFTGFQIVPIEKQFSHLQAWRWEALYWIAQVEEQKRKLSEEIFIENTIDKLPFMGSFPKNTNSCFAFNTACPYLDLCKAWPNPMNKGVPPGFKVEPWEPLERSDSPVMKPPEAAEAANA